MRHLLLILFTITIHHAASAQIAGIAASKVAAINVQPIPVRTAELEPSFNYARNNTASDSININSNITWRVTYGATEDIEIGFNAGPGFSNACLSAKMRVYEKDKLAFGIMAGTSIKLGNNNIGADDRLIQGYGLGLISSHVLNEKNSIDLNAQYFSNKGSTDSFIFNGEWGTYSLHEEFQFVIGIGYQTTSANPIVSLYTGFSLENADNYGMVITPTFTLSGADLHTNPQTFGLGLTSSS